MPPASFASPSASGALCLFATHFHELTTIEQEKKGKGVQNLHVTADADPASNKLTMLYKVTQGSCDRSFGIHVARIANFPVHVVSMAESLATALENGEPLCAQFSDDVPKQATPGVCKPDDVIQPGVSGQEEIPTGPKRKSADVSEVPAEKRSR